MIATLAAVILIGALLGSIPFGVIMSKLFGRPDPREKGSGNVGATNVLRTGGAAPALLTLAGDILKGAAAAGALPGLAGAPPGSLAAPALAGLAAVLGHMFSPFVGFRGGKGVATGLGVLALLMPGPTAWGVLVFAAAAGATRYVSVGSMLGAITIPLAGALGGHPPALIGVAALIALLIVWRHKENIARLRRGEENRIGASA